MADCRFIAFHGWGFNPTFWSSWSRELTHYGPFTAYDRGYFFDTEEQNIELATDQVATVLITHSMGLHWISRELLQQADLLIITGGFLYFHPYAAQLKRRSRLVLQEMINEFEVHPEEVLSEFYQNCYAPGGAPEINMEQINHQQLLDDLILLNHSEMDANLLKGIGRSCILHGTDDYIVPNKKGRQIYNQLQDKAQYFELKKAGHALPYTHTRQCLEFITPEIDQLLNRIIHEND